MSDNYVQILSNTNTGGNTVAVTLTGVVAGNAIVAFGLNVVVRPSRGVSDAQGAYTAQGPQIDDSSDSVSGQTFVLPQRQFRLSHRDPDGDGHWLLLPSPGGSRHELVGRVHMQMRKANCNRRRPARPMRSPPRPHDRGGGHSRWVLHRWLVVYRRLRPRDRNGIHLPRERRKCGHWRLSHRDRGRIDQLGCNLHQERRALPGVTITSRSASQS